MILSDDEETFVMGEKILNQLMENNSRKELEQLLKSLESKIYNGDSFSLTQEQQEAVLQLRKHLLHCCKK
jgi:hypothetical protein